MRRQRGTKIERLVAAMVSKGKVTSRQMREDEELDIMSHTFYIFKLRKMGFRIDTIRILGEHQIIDTMYKVRDKRSVRKEIANKAGFEWII